MTELIAKLEAPFGLEAVDFKTQSVKGDKAMLVTYIDARAVAQRLDEVFPLSWQARYEVMQHTDSRLVLMCYLHVTADGKEIVRCDVGESDNDDSESSKEASRWKSAVSDAFKRAAVPFGIGRYLYSLPKFWVNYDAQKRRVADNEMKRVEREYLEKTNLGAPREMPKPQGGPAKTTAIKSTLFTNERASAMHEELGKLGIKNHYDFASRILEREIKTLTELSEAEALEVWSAAKRQTRKANTTEGRIQDGATYEESFGRN
jgi:hypothetical protein